MKKMTLFLAILIVSRVGVAFGADIAPNGLQNFFLGISSTNAANINQVLALLVGPAGPPGAAGVAGRDGFSGLNGVDGMPGAPGPVGQTGPQGLQGIQGLQGLQGAAGAPGPAGATGAQGPAGPAGTGSGGTLGYTGGTVGLTGCATNVTIDIARKFTSSGFRLQAISVGGIPAGCIGQNLLVYATDTAANTVKCTTAITAAGSITVNKDSECVIDGTSTPVTNFFWISGTTGTTISNLDPAIGVEITE
jgi:hypothetical protein